jgi:hypothetical protein
MTRRVIVERLLRSRDPAIRRLAGDRRAEVLASPLVKTLLQFPPEHPYKKWWGTHWRLVALADLGVPPGTRGLALAIDRELEWLTSAEHRRTVVSHAGRVHSHASQEGNAIYSCTRLGSAADPRLRQLVESLLEWQWPDGGWNCDVRSSGRRSSFHETVTPAIGLAVYSASLGDAEGLSAARRAAELLLDHRLFRTMGRGTPVHPSWIQPHYPPYWHYDLLQGLRLAQAVGQLDDPRASDALDELERSRRRDGRFSGPSWESVAQRDAVRWGRGPGNEMLNLRIESILQAADRGGDPPV